MNTFTLNLDLDKRFENDYVRIRQGDQNGTTIVANIYDHGTALDGTGLTARIRMRLPDGEHFYEKDATFSNGVATVTIDETQAASVSGTTDNAYFQILSGSTVIASTQDFTVRVLRDATSDAEVGENYSTQIQQAIDSLNDMTATIPEKVVDEVDAQLAAHPEWTTTVQDNSLDDDKLIQKGGILQREQWLETMLPNIPRKATSESDVHSVTDSAGGGPLGIEVYGRSTQDGTPTPDAPVAIVSVGPDSDGGVKLWAAGRNLIQRGDVSHTTNGITFTINADGSVTANGTATATAFHNYILSMYLPAGTYHLSGSPAGGSSAKWQNKIQIVGGEDVAVDTGSGKTFTLTEGATVRPLIRIASGCVCDNLTFYSQLEVGSTATPYQPYESVTIPIDLGGRSLRSLPDGTRDEVTVDEWGHVVLTQRIGSVDLGTLNWAKYAADTSGHSFYASSPSSMAHNQQDQVPPFLCTVYTAAAFGSTINTWVTKDNAICQVAGPYRVIVRDTAQTDAATFKTAMDDITLLYKLATPQTIDLGYLDPALLPAPDLTAYVVPSAPSVLRYGFDVAAAIAELATA